MLQLIQIWASSFCLSLNKVPVNETDGLLRSIFKTVNLKEKDSPEISSITAIGQMVGEHSFLSDVKTIDAILSAKGSL